MKKNSTPTFFAILDQRNAYDFNEANKNYDESSDHLPSVPIETKRLFNIYLDLSAAIEETLEKEKDEVLNEARTIIIRDVRCGVGSSLEFFGMSFIEDAVFPHVEGQCLTLIGNDPDQAMLDVAYPLLNRISPNVKLSTESFVSVDPTAVFDAIYMENVLPGDINIVFCPKLFKDDDFNLMLEEQLIKTVPYGTFLIFPDNIIGAYQPGLRFYSRHIFRKEGENVDKL